MKIDLNKIKKHRKASTSINIDKETYGLVKNFCSREDINFSKLVEILLKDFLKEVGVK